MTTKAKKDKITPEVAKKAVKKVLTEGKKRKEPKPVDKVWKELKTKTPPPPKPRSVKGHKTVDLEIKPDEEVLELVTDLALCRDMEIALFFKWTAPLPTEDEEAVNTIIDIALDIGNDGLFDNGFIKWDDENLYIFAPTQQELIDWLLIYTDRLVNIC